MSYSCYGNNNGQQPQEQLFSFWTKSIELFPERRFYTTKLYPRDCRFTAKGPPNWMLVVDICSDSDTAHDESKWEDSETPCLVAFNALSAEVSSFADVVKKIKNNRKCVDISKYNYPLLEPYFVQWDKILEFYIKFQKQLVSKLAERGVKVPDQVQGNYVCGINLRSLPEKYIGINLIVATLQCLKVKIHEVCSNVRSMRGNFHAPPREFLGDVALDVDALLEKYELPDEVVNGYWLYTKQPAFDAQTDARNVIYVTPNALKTVKTMTRGGSLSFGQTLRLDESLDHSKIVDSKGVASDIAGFVQIKSGDRRYNHSPIVPDLTCLHARANIDQMYCSDCCGHITTGASYISCKKCGSSTWNEALIYCFCEGEGDVDGVPGSVIFTAYAPDTDFQSAAEALAHRQMILSDLAQSQPVYTLTTPTYRPAAQPAEILMELDPSTAAAPRADGF